MLDRRWLNALLIAACSGAANASADCDVDAGRKQFAKCAACHATDAGIHGAGPSLAGIMGRTAGSQPGFLFTEALEQADIVWDASTLSAFIENPGSYVPGNVMPFGGIRNHEQRRALVCFLATL